MKKDGAAITEPRASETGREYWRRLTAAFRDSSEVRHSNRVWIVPDRVVVARGERDAYIVEARMRVDLETSYLEGRDAGRRASGPAREAEAISREIVVTRLTAMVRFSRSDIVFFNHFDRADYRRITHGQLDRLVEEMRGRGIELAFEPGEGGVLDTLVDLAWEQRISGARPVRNLINEHIRDQMIAARQVDPTRARFRFSGQLGSRQVILEDSQ